MVKLLTLVQKPKLILSRLLVRSATDRAEPRINAMTLTLLRLILLAHTQDHSHDSEASSLAPQAVLRKLISLAIIKYSNKS